MLATKYKVLLPTVVCLGLIIILMLSPSPYQRMVHLNQERVPVRVIDVDNQYLKNIGAILVGEQMCQVEILKGNHKGEVVDAVNLMTGSLEKDKVFKIGDRALAVIDSGEEATIFVNLVDHYRLNSIMLLITAFIVMLVGFAGFIGARSILSFILTLLMIWKVFIPSILSGYSPLLVGFFMTLVLTIMIITLVFGIDKRALSAIMGSLFGTCLTLFLAVILVDIFKIEGAVLPHIEGLIYSGFGHLNLTQIYITSIFIACSGAMMDVAVDIASSVDEVVKHNPELDKKSAIKSGIRVGRAVMGTMTTTLLLAYSGGFISLLLIFMAQGTPLINILNLKFVSAEILHTLIGSIGLVTVAPFTAFFSGMFLGKGLERKKILKNIEIISE